MMDTASAAKHWYLIYSKPRNEACASRNLTRQGYTVYLPMIHARRRYRGRYIPVVVPMFPRYLFVYLDTETDNWAPIRSTRGVSHVVSFGYQPARVPDDLVSLLREREGSDGALPGESLEFRVGDRVRIVDGALAGYEASFSGTSSRQRVTVLLEIAGRLARIKLSPGQLERA